MTTLCLVRRSMGSLLSMGWGTLLVLTCLSAQAQSPQADAPILQSAGSPSTSGKALFDEGQRLMGEHRYREACAIFEESLKLEAQGATLLGLGDCYERQGRLATAQRRYLEAAQRANQAGDVARERDARWKAQGLDGRIPKLRLRLPAANWVTGMIIKRDGKPVRPEELGVAVPVDPAITVLQATAPGCLAWTLNVEILSSGEVTTVEVPKLDFLAAPPWEANAPPVTPLSAPVADPDRVNTVAAPSERPQAQPNRSRGLGSTRTAALVVGGLGLAGIGVGTILGLNAIAQRDQAGSHCSGSYCQDQAGVDLMSSAMGLARASTVAFLVGVVGLGTGTTLWILGAPQSGTAPGAASLRRAPVVKAGLGSLLFEGQW